MLTIFGNVYCVTKIFYRTPKRSGFAKLKNDATPCKFSIYEDKDENTIKEMKRKHFTIGWFSCKLLPSHLKTCIPLRSSVILASKFNDNVNFFNI